MAMEEGMPLYCEFFFSPMVKPWQTCRRQLLYSSPHHRPRSPARHRAGGAAAAVPEAPAAPHSSLWGQRCFSPEPCQRSSRPRGAP